MVSIVWVSSSLLNFKIDKLSESVTNSSNFNLLNIMLLIVCNLILQLVSSGAQYDAAGQERNWWDDSDLVEFDNKKECFKNQYGKFSLHGMQVDGAETLNENIADNGGLELSFESYKAAVDGFDYSLPGLESDEMFFLAYAQMWCDVTNKDWYLNGDAHSPMKYRYANNFFKIQASPFSFCTQDEI